MSLVSSQEGLSGLLVTGGFSFNIIPRGANQVTVLKIDLNQLPPESEPETGGSSTARPNTSAVGQTSLSLVSEKSSLPHIHDLLVVYTDDVATSRPNVTAKIIEAITLANLSYTNSKINIKLNLVAAEEVSYAEPNDLGTDLGRLTETNDGFLDDVHRLRDRYAADLVVLLVLNAGDSCGKANLQISSSDADDDRAFAVTDFDCLDLSTLTHELAHIAGAHHNTGHDPFPVPSYAHGWVRHDQFSSSKGWRSTMAYNTGECGDRPDGCPRMPPAFSNPDIRIGGKPAGNSSANNARRLNETAQTLAGFRIPGPRISLYEGNGSTQDHVCVVQIARNTRINFSSTPNERKCDNDEARSVTLFDVPAGRVLRFFDHPDGNREDDWTEVIVKRNVSEVDIPSFEQSFENDDIRVIYHRNNGLDGKVSRLVIDSSPTGPTVDLHEGNNATQNLVCSITIGQPRNYRFPNHSECDNDEARSATLYSVRAGQVIRLFDHPGGSREDDWTEITIKRNTKKVVVPTFERSFEDQYIRVVYHRENGLDGKVSRLEVKTRPIGPIIDLYEGNSGTQDIVCSILVGQPQTYRFPSHSECDNDEASSLVLHNVPAGTVLILYDSANGNLDDDWLAIRVKRDLRRLPINSFERSFTNSQVDIVYARNNGLDGKVSRLVVTSGNSMDGVASFYEGNSATQNKVCDLDIRNREVRFKGHGSCDNDEARSVVLSLVSKGGILRVYDDPDCETGDDYTVIQLKNDVFRLQINTFERSFENDKVRVIHRHNNGLDGKVSCVRFSRFD